MTAAEAAIEEGRVAADVMLRTPKTLPGAATVAEVRAQLADPKVQMVLLADDGRFVGAVTDIPDAAGADERAADYADPEPDTIAPNEPARAAFDRVMASAHRRVIVLGDDGSLAGLVCLNSKRTGFCQTPQSST